MKISLQIFKHQYLPLTIPLLYLCTQAHTLEKYMGAYPTLEHYVNTGNIAEIRKCSQNYTVEEWKELILNQGQESLFVKVLLSDNTPLLAALLDPIRGNQHIIHEILFTDKEPGVPILAYALVNSSNEIITTLQHFLFLHKMLEPTFREVSDKAKSIIKSLCLTQEGEWSNQGPERSSEYIFEWSLVKSKESSPQRIETMLSGSIKADRVGRYVISVETQTEDKGKAFLILGLSAVILGSFAVLLYHKNPKTHLSKERQRRKKSKEQHPEQRRKEQKYNPPRSSKRESSTIEPHTPL